MVASTGSGGIGTAAPAQLGGVFGQKASPYLGAVLKGITTGANFQQQPQAPRYLSGGFDPQGYMSRYPDVAQAVQAGQVPSAMYHYMNWGMNEGRAPNALASGGGPNYLGSMLAGKYNNEANYLRANPDVAGAVQSGAVPNGFGHYMPFGLREGRSPTGFGLNIGSQPQWMVPRQMPPGMTPTSVGMPGLQYTEASNMPWLQKPMTPATAPATPGGAMTGGATGGANGMPLSQDDYIKLLFSGGLPQA